jgi:ubiquinone/menaquinone biosynthesis C-methylase UbiE
MTLPTNPTIKSFNADVQVNQGYLYTTNARLSSQLANQRLTDVTLETVPLAGKSVIDIGCGDGTYTFALYDSASPSSMVGVDPATSAIEAARGQIGSRKIKFEVADAAALPYDDGSFDVAHLRGVLHHMENPQGAIKEALRVAHSVLVIEPNGYNPVLKVLEKVSPYHRQHHEKSYAPHSLVKWVEDAGGVISRRRYAGLVPFFCPDVMAEGLKKIEPFVEAMPWVNSLTCAVYVFLATRRS